MFDVIIIGGGASGLMAAKILAGKGKKILLLEATGRLGGRIHRIEDLSFPAEGGAEFIHGNLKTTFGLLKEAHLKKEKLKGKFCRIENGKWRHEEELVPHWEFLIKKLKACNEDISIHDFLEKYFHQKKYETLGEQFKKYIEGYDAADPARTSVFAIREEMEEEDEEQYRPKPDYYALINFLRDSCLSNDGVIKINEPVKKISRNKNIEVQTLSKKYFGKKLIIAVPVGVLQCNKSNGSFINFPAFLNSYIKAAKKIGNGGVIKFLLEFDKAFWLEKQFLKDRNIPPPSYIFSDAIIPTWWTHYPSKDPLLTGWIAGPSSYKMSKYSDEKFKELVLRSLSYIFSMPAKEIQQRLKDFKVINWITMPYFSGGYSYPTLQTEEARSIMQKPYEESFYFAGEYLANNSSSTVDAALQSGREVAAKILEGE